MESGRVECPENRLSSGHATRVGHEVGVSDGLPFALRERIKAQERELKELRQANETLRLVSA